MTEAAYYAASSNAVVPRKRLELLHLAAPEPKSGASTNFATWAQLMRA